MIDSNNRAGKTAPINVNVFKNRRRKNSDGQSPDAEEQSPGWCFFESEMIKIKQNRKFEINILKFLLFRQFEQKKISRNLGNSSIFKKAKEMVREWCRHTVPKAP
jgi:hypothetical protein